MTYVSRKSLVLGLALGAIFLGLALAETEVFFDNVWNRRAPVGAINTFVVRLGQDQVLVFRDTEIALDGAELNVVALNVRFEGTTLIRSFPPGSRPDPVVQRGAAGRDGAAGPKGIEGEDGDPGGQGPKGSPGRDGSTVAITVYGDISGSGSLRLLLTGEAGGRGGPGGPGGNGGRGGNGHNGSDYLFGCRSGPGPGRDGGDGGVGGPGGRGGDGGNGGLAILSPNLAAWTSLLVQGGSGGRGGPGGDGGLGGEGGSRGHRTTYCTTRQPGGNRGADGRDGSDGAIGERGSPGELVFQ